MMTMVDMVGGAGGSIGLSTVCHTSRMYSTVIQYCLPYQWTFGIMTTVAGIRLVVNHICCTLMAIYGQLTGHNTRNKFVENDFLGMPHDFFFRARPHIHCPRHVLWVRAHGGGQ